MPGPNNAQAAKQRKQPKYLPKSLPLLLARRIEGQYQLNGRPFVIGVTRQFSPTTLVQNLQLLTPQTQNNITNNKSINALHVDRVENRFVLAGGADAIVSIYDLSKWGSEEYYYSRQANSRRRTTIHNNSIHKPIASSRRKPPRSVFSSETVEIPRGHSSPLSQVQWYPVDSGAFLSSSKDGALLVWDTDSMTPVAHCTPFDHGIASFHLSSRRIYSAVVASLSDPSLKLVDIRSGASSHTLLGHAPPGVSSVQWAPHNDVILASGGLDGTVRLWDIRKAGGRACVAILNQDKTHPPRRVKPYKADYSHLPKPSAARNHSLSFAGEEETRRTTIRSGSHKRPSAAAAPNNYRSSETTTVTSHAGGVSALSFGVDGHSLVSAGQDGNIHCWDLRGNGHLRPLKFLAPGKEPAIFAQRKQTPLLLTTFGGTDGGSCWVGHGSKLLGWSLDRGGLPHKVLQGHLSTVTAMDAMEANLQILTAGRDGMILTWGRKSLQGTATQRKRKVDEDSW